MEQQKVNSKRENWLTVSVVLVSLVVLGVGHLIADNFFGFDIVHYAVWPLWPALAFALYRFVRPALRGEGKERQEYWRLTFYCLIGVVVVFGRALTLPFSSFEEVICISYWVYPFLFPVVMWFGLFAWNVVRIVSFSVYVIFFVLSTLFVGVNYYLNRGYYDFLSRDQKYYAKVVEACNELLSKTNPSSNVLEFQGDDKSVPPILRELHPRKVFANYFSDDRKNYVGVEVGVSRSGFRMSWGQSDSGNGLWELSVNGDSGGAVVYSAQNVVGSKR